MGSVPADGKIDAEKRDVDAESLIPKLEAIKFKKDRKEDAGAKKERPADQNPMLWLVREIVISPNSQDISTYEPSANMLGYVIQLISNNINSDQKLVKNHFDFHPCRFQIYIFTMWVVQALRATCAAGIASFAQKTFLRNFEAAGFLNYRIPGPLVPFFSALAAGPPKDPEYGIICPVIPLIDLAAAPWDLPALQRDTLPPLPYLRHALLCIQNVQANQAFAALANLEWRCFPGAAGVAIANFDHNDAAVHTAHGRLSPGLGDYDFPNDGIFKNVAVRMRTYQILPPAPAVANGNTVDVYLGLNNDVTWFKKLCDVCDWVAEIFDSSARVADIPPMGMGVGQFITVLDQDYANDEDLRDYHGALLNREASLETPQMRPDDFIGKLAALTAINWRPPANVGQNAARGHPGQANSGLVGPFWGRTPDSVQTTACSPTYGIVEVIEKMRR